MKSIFSLAAIAFLFSGGFGGFPSAAWGEPPIRIGATVSLSGPYREPSLMIQKAFMLWEKETNESGGLLGRKVKLILYDDQSRPEQAKVLYQKLIEEDRVDLVFSPYGTPLTLAASAVSERHKMLMLACAASGEVIWERGYRYVFGVYSLANRYFIGLLDMMARKGYTTVSLIYNDASPFNIDVAEGAKKWAKRFKVAVVHEKRYQNGEEQLPAIVADLKAAGARHLIVSAYSPDCYRLLHLMEKAAYHPKVLGMTVAPIHPDFWKKAGIMADGVFGPSQWEPNERIPFPGTKRFVAAFKRFAGKLPSYHAGSAYAACQLYAEAIGKTQSLDKEKIRNYIAALDTVTIIGRFKVGPSGKQIGHNPITIQWQDGKKEIVWPSKMKTAQPRMQP